MNMLFWCLGFSLAAHGVVSFDYTPSPRNPIEGDLRSSFGWSSAFVGQGVLVVGARAEGGVGRVYVYRLDSLSSFVEIQNFTAPKAHWGSSFGHNIASSGNTVVISAPGQLGYGAVYTYEWDGSELKQSPQVIRTFLKILGSSLGSGQGLALLGHRLVVGAPGTPTDGKQVGRVFSYSRLRAGEDWSLRQIIYAPQTAQSFQFGHSVTIGGPKHELLCVGQYPNTVHTYEYRPRAYAKYYKLKSMTNVTGFGNSVSMDNNTLAVGTRVAVEMYEFDHDQKVWKIYKRLPGPGFGRYVILRGDALIVSTYRNVVVYEITNAGNFEKKPDLGDDMPGFGMKPSLSELWLAVGDNGRGLYLYQRSPIANAPMAKAVELNLAVDKRKTSHKDPSILVALSAVGIVIIAAVKVSWDACKTRRRECVALDESRPLKMRF